MKLKQLGKRGQTISPLISGVGALVILVILIFVIVSTIGDANLLTSGSAEDNSTQDLRKNLTAGVDEVSKKIPTVLKVAAVVLLIGILVFLFQRAQPIIGSRGGSL